VVAGLKITLDHHQDRLPHVWEIMIGASKARGKRKPRQDIRLVLDA